MDLSKFKASTWLMVAGGAIMLIFGLALDWAEYAGASGNNAFDYPLTGGLAWLLVVATAVLAVLVTTGTVKEGTAPWPLILLAASGLGALLMLLRVLLGGGEEGAAGFTFELDRGIGMYFAFLAAILAAVGAVMNFRESGGDLADLKDPSKIKQAFSKDAGQAPPPPPPPPPSA
jgi:hypothetical protein